MKSLLAKTAGRRGKWVVLAVWLIAVIGFSAAQLPSKFDKVQKNESTSFLPDKAESTKALKATRAIQGQESVTMLAVYRRASGLTRADKATILAQRPVERLLAGSLEDLV
ncbi:MAG: hypothetical protein WCK97_09785, partial [Actinomycetes bacterium]